MKFPRVGAYVSMRGDGSKYLNNSEMINAQARWDDIILDVGCLENNPTVKDQFRQANPNLNLWGYVAMLWWGTDQYSPMFFQEMNRIVHETDGICWGYDNQTWSVSNISLAKDETVNQIAKLIIKYIADYDAIVLDCLVPKLTDQQTDIDYARMGYMSMGDYATAWNAGALNLVAMLRATGKPVITNYGNEGLPNANGHVNENFPHQPVSDWNLIMDGLFHAPHDEPKSNWILSAPTGVWKLGKLVYDPNYGPNPQKHLFGLASACLMGGFHGFGRYEDDVAWCEQRHTWWYKEYAHPQRGKYWLGEPADGAFHLTVSKGKPVDLWVRYFQYGVVVVNPSDVAHSIYFDTKYRPIGADAKKGWSIPAKSGFIAEKV